MKIIVFSDIHGNLPALEAIVNDIKLNKYNEVICLGDAIAMGPNPKECLDLIIDNNYKMVLGNHELYYLKGTKIDDEMEENEIKHQNWVKNQLNEKHVKFLKNCEMSINLNFLGEKLSFQHFLINENTNEDYPFEELSILKNDSIKEKFNNIDTNYLFIGHEHKDFLIDLKNKKLIDVGSSGCRKDDITLYTIITVLKDKINVEKKYITYDREKFIKNIRSIDYPNKEKISKIFFGVDI